MADVTRRGRVITSDTQNVESDCQLIVFINKGDTDVAIQIQGSDLVFDLKGESDVRTDQILFGGLSKPDNIERSVFDVTFGTLVTTKKLLVMRVYVK